MTEQYNETQQALLETKKLIEEKGWGQGSDWRYPDPDVSMRKEDRYNFCLSGAVHTVSPVSGDASRALHKAAQEKGFSTYVQFNDASGRTKEEVLQLIDRAITLAA